MSRAVLVLLGLALTGLGLASLLRPSEMAAIVELPLAAPMARVDVRAIYGGAITGIGVFVLSCAFLRSTLRTGLIAAACVFGGAALGRVIGLSAEGFAQPLMLIVAVLETVAAGLAVWGAWTAPSPVLPVLPAPAAPASDGSRSLEDPFAR